MIPKVIHYCWFGHGELTEKMKYCVESWRRIMPDYQIIEWNETNYDISQSCDFVRQAYANRKFAHVSDYVRLEMIYKYGGVYFDIDVEAVKPLDKFLANDKLTLGLDVSGNITGAILISPQGNSVIKAFMHVYESMQFVMPNGKLKTEVNNVYMEQYLSQLGYKKENQFQQMTGIDIYPDDYFQAYRLSSGKLNVTDNTHTIHWHAVSWGTPKTKFIKFIRLNILVPIFGERLYSIITKRIKGNATTI